MFTPNPENTGSNLGRGPEICFRIYGTVKRILGEKSPETVDAPGFCQTHLYRFVFMVEARGVEPLSESISTGTSPSADDPLHSLTQAQVVTLLGLVES